MSRTRLLLVIVVLVLVAGVAIFFSRRGPAESAIDLVAMFADTTRTERRSNHDNAFATETVTIDGQAKPSIVARPAARIIYTVAVPADAWLETSFALKPEVWQQKTDGAQFRIGVSEGRTYDELLRQVVVPSRGDTRWFTARLDLSVYAGRTVKVIFNTDPGPPGSRSVDFDEAVWGAPRIYVKR
jgi:hypothetical protein